MTKRLSNDEDSMSFCIKQIETTKRIINKFSNASEFSPTMLLNSLLSLVVLPFEDAKKRDGTRIFRGEMKELLKTFGGVSLEFRPIKRCTAGKPEFERKNIYSFIRKFRNGIAHQNLTVFVDQNKEVFIRIYNKFSCSDCKKCKEKKCKEKGLKISGAGVKDFEISVTVPQLQRIALYIADSYLRAIRGE